MAGPGKNNISYIHKVIFPSLILTHVLLVSLKCHPGLNLLNIQDKEAGDDPDIEGILKACCWS